MSLGPDALGALALSLKVATVAAFVTLPLAFLVAYALARWRFPGAGALNVLVHLPLVLPPVVTGYLLLIAFGRNGTLGSALAELGITFAFHWTGAALAAGVMAFPLMVRPMRLALEAIDPKLEEAARTLGASDLRVLRTVTLPMALPGVVVALVMGWAKALGEFGATITFVGNIPGETRTLPTAIYTALQAPGQERVVWTLVLITTLLAVLAVVLSEVWGQRVARRISGGADA